ncbi:AEC family transporter [Georgenia subflava]|uniref:AEC family transporter n=1 Tax=Georgenia subflava TaxID=1622177 RepID=UPI00186B260C|nr:AEC family transporter [Georgenia subflava]
MLGAVEGFLIVGVVIGIGYALGGSRIVGEHGSEVLAKITFNVSTPALFFVLVAGSEPADIFSTVGYVTVLYVVGGGLLFLLVHRLFVRVRSAELPLVVQGAVFANAGNIGIPLSLATVGDLSYTTVLLLVQAFILTPVGLISLDLTAARLVRRPSDALKLAINPVLLGAFAGMLVLVTGVELPHLVLEPIDLVAATSVPLTLLLFGMSFRGKGRSKSQDSRAAGLVVVWKCFVMPALAVALGLAFGLRGADLFGVVVLAALPSAQNLFVLAMQYRTAITLTHSFILVSTLVSVPVVLVLAALVPH